MNHVTWRNHLKILEYQLNTQVRNDRVLPGIVVFDSSKRKESIRDQVSDSSRVSAWSKFFLDPSDSLVYFKMCRHLNRLKLLNKPSSQRKEIKQRKKHPAIVKFSTKRRSSSPSSVEMLNKSSDLQSMMQSPMKRRRKSFDQSELMMSVERTPMNGDKKSRNLTPMSVDTSVNKRNILNTNSSAASKIINKQ